MHAYVSLVKYTYIHIVQYLTACFSSPRDLTSCVYITIFDHVYIRIVHLFLKYTRSGFLCIYHNIWSRVHTHSAPIPQVHVIWLLVYGAIFDRSICLTTKDSQTTAAIALACLGMEIFVPFTSVLTAEKRPLPWVSICMRVCIYVCVHVYVCVRLVHRLLLEVCVSSTSMLTAGKRPLPWVSVCTSVCMRVCIYVWVQVCMHTMCA